MRLVHAEAGEPEIAHLDIVVAVNEKVIGLDVAMDDGRLAVVQVEDACRRLPVAPVTLVNRPAGDYGN